MAEHGQPVPGQGLYLLAKNVWVETLARALPDLSSEQNKKQNGAKTKQNRLSVPILYLRFFALLLAQGSQHLGSQSLIFGSTEAQYNGRAE